MRAAHQGELKETAEPRYFPYLRVIANTPDFVAPTRQ